MQIPSEIESYKDEMIHLRRDIHAHPELAYQEERTAGLVAECLERWGVEVDRGLGKTGVVGTLSKGSGPSIGLRADMDALPMYEGNTFEHRSRFPGRMHACGHDGHTTMLLGAARYLAEHGNFSGTVRFIFQPAEEAAGGAKRMMDEGLFERFPVDAVFGMHNWPGLGVGRFGTCTGPLMASLDCFDIRIEGKGTHGATPQRGVDPIVASTQVISAFQTIGSGNGDPLAPAVVSGTKIHGGDAHNVIPAHVQLGGGVRCFDPAVREILHRRMREVVEGICASLGALGTVEFLTQALAVVNSPESTTLASRTAAELVGHENVAADFKPVMVSEDFSYMLQDIPGCFVFIGNGEGEGGCTIHNPGYDFNDDVLTLGASYWVSLARNFLREEAG